MFSTMPMTGKPVFLQNVSSRRTSPTDTAYQSTPGAKINITLSPQ